MLLGITKTKDGTRVKIKAGIITITTKIKDGVIIELLKNIQQPSDFIINFYVLFLYLTELIIWYSFIKVKCEDIKKH